MKRFIIPGFIAVIVLAACEVQPYADFAVRDTLVQPGDRLYFDNLSERAVSYDWDFGDGTYSNNFNVSHTYYNEGTYTVTLTVTSKDGNIDRVSTIIEVYYTELEITAWEWNEFEDKEFIVPDARVRLYASYDDWYDEYNYIAQGTTNSNGVVYFYGLPEQRFYVDVQAPEYDNFALGQFDIGYIETPVMTPGVLYLFTAWCDWYPAGLREEKRTINAVSKINAKRSAFNNADVSK